MITKFDNYRLITEDPDSVWDEEKQIHYIVDNEDAMPFSVEVNDDHTEVELIRFGDNSTYHSDMYEGENRAYPGRIWTKSKIIAFWVYPNDVLFKEIIKKMEEELDIKIFDNGWKMEIQRKEKKGKIKIKKRKVRSGTDYYMNDDGYENAVLLPIEEYIGSEDVPDEQKKMHLMNWKEKDLAKRAGLINLKGWGSDRTAYDQPRNIAYRQSVFQENKKENDN